MKQSINNIHRVVVHCAATKPSMDIGRKEIDSWHKANGWAGIGYHYVIRRNGEVELGRDLTEVPAANGAGNNLNTITICWVGGLNQQTGKPEDNRTLEQRKFLYELRKNLDVLLNNPKWIGHRDIPGVKKDCPCFDVKTEFYE
jgi:N-acetylmuramoyl-L-alanine amidase